VTDALRVGVRVPHGVFEAGPSALEATLDQIEVLGFDHVCLGDHVSFHNGRGYDGLIQATAVAVAHPRLPVHLAVYQLALRHPVPVARQLSSLSELSPGRLVFGVGVGGEDRHEVEVAGVDPSTRGRRTDESLNVLRRLLSGAPVTSHGEFFDLDDALIRPAPNPPIPIVIGGRSDPAKRRTARFGDGWIGVWTSPERFAATTAEIEAMALADGRASVEWQHELLMWCGIGESNDDARQLLAPAMEQLYKVPFARFDQHVVYGTPDEVAGLLQEHVDAGVRTLNLLAVGADVERALEGTAAVRERLISSRPVLR
jgi:alkanesulfonate monooxygenase SsuD/methylene tetrahydromethanopterin reductase-like flavin-dependent oxidoreductase (luciferase family)